MKEVDYSQACESELYLLETSDLFRNKLLTFTYTQDQIYKLPEKLSKLETTLEKEQLLEIEYTVAYIYLQKLIGRDYKLT